MAARIATALVGIPLFLGALIAGGPWWLALVALLCVLGAWESARLAFPGHRKRLRPMSVIAACTAAAAAYIGGRGGGAGALVVGAATLAFTAWLFAHALTARAPRPGDGEIPLRHAAGVALYPAPYFAHLGLLRDEGLAAALLPVLVTWATDTAAYFTGRALGKTPLAPRISPKKTVEGAAGGLVAGIAAAAIFGRFAGGSPLAWALAGLAASLAAQAGDLVESGLKRKAGVKDSGALLPGHGGVLDRFDSLMIASAVVYYLLLAVR